LGFVTGVKRDSTEYAHWIKAETGIIRELHYEEDRPWSYVQDNAKTGLRQP
jgi:hypothetical protein